MKLPQMAEHSVKYTRIFLLQELPPPLTRMDEHWQIFDDYTAWPEYRIRQIRLPHTREWFRAREEITTETSGKCLVENITREIIPGEGSPASAMHPDKEIRKNRYFYEFANREVAIDVFLGPLWGLTLAQVEFTENEEAGKFPGLDFAISEVTLNEFFHGENLVDADFEKVKLIVNG